MNCETCQRHLAQYVLGDLDPSVAYAVEEHIESGCVSCLSELTSIGNSVECLIEDSALKSPSDATWERLEEAIESDRLPESAGRSQVDRSSSLEETPSWLKHGFAAMLAVACGFMIAIVGLNFVSLAPERTAGDFSADHPPTSPSNVPVGQFSDGALPKSGDRPASHLVSFREPERLERVAGSMFFDTNAKQIHVHVEIPSGDSFTVWFVTEDQEWIEAGELDRLSSNHFGKVIDVPKTDSPIAYAAIVTTTDDPSLDPESAVALVSDTVGDAIRASL
ncbi:zf-HC2 domain-containing protein [Rubripirellula amarantea]|nr:zf-HC2 domain-containing protein [Rubripirellula amarantea]